MTLSAAAIIPAAGFGTRMHLDHPKQYHLLVGLPIIVHTVRAFINNSYINRIIVVVPADWLEQTKTLFDRYQINVAKLAIVAGGRRRQDSVQAGLKALDDETAIVLVHDGARPLVSREIIDRCYLAALHHGAGIAAVPVKDTLKRGDDTGKVTATIDRTSLWQAQTPQAVRKELLEKAYLQNGDADVTDESSPAGKGRNSGKPCRRRRNQYQNHPTRGPSFGRKDTSTRLHATVTYRPWL